MPAVTQSSRDRTLSLLTADPNARIALRGIAVRSRLTPLGHQTTVEQTFLNGEDKPIEALYTFPLPDRAAVCGLEILTGERVLTGTIKEVEKAVEKHEQAMSEGHASFLLEQHRPDVFTISVGSLKPHQAVTIRLTYVCEVEMMDRTMRVAFPTTIAPRYGTATGVKDRQQAAMDADALNPPHVLNVPYGLTFEMDLELGRPVAGITSPSHAVSVADLGEGRRRVSLAGGMTEANRDIVLEVRLKEEPKPSALVAVGPDGATYGAVTFVPEFDPGMPAPPAIDVVFVVDCSGSMEGSSIDQARAALGLCLRQLRAGDRFNILCFGDAFEWMSPEPLVYSASTLEKALAFVHHIKADKGGTEMYGPLASLCGDGPVKPQPLWRQKLLKRHSSQGVAAENHQPGGVRQVILLTDAQVSNETAILDLVRPHRGRLRIFPFGIGAAASGFLLRNLAELTRGTAESIAPNERIEEKVLRTFSRLGGHAIGSLRLTWEGTAGQTLQAELAPSTLPPLFEGDALTILTRFEKEAPRRFSLACAGSAKELDFQVDLGTAVQDGGTLARLWARRTIHELEHGAHADPQNRQRIVELSKRHGVVCGQTAFVAVEHRSIEDRANGRPESRRVPLQLAQGWGGAENMILACLAPSAISGCEAMPETLSEDRRSRRLYHRIRPREVLGQSARGPRRIADFQRADVKSPLLKLLELMEADGHFEGGLGALAHDQGLDRLRPAVDEWVRRQPRAGTVDRDQLDRLRATLLALVLLHKAFAAEQPTWRRAHAKAVAWVCKVTGSDPVAVQAFVEDGLRSL